jgi:hypothetical protein
LFVDVLDRSVFQKVVDECVVVQRFLDKSWHLVEHVDSKERTKKATWIGIDDDETVDLSNGRVKGYHVVTSELSQLLEQYIAFVDIDKIHVQAAIYENGTSSTTIFCRCSKTAVHLYVSLVGQTVKLITNGM